MQRNQTFRASPLSIAIVAALAVSCSRGSSRSGSPSPGEALGTVSVGLQDASGLSFASVQYNLLEPSGTVEKSGNIDVSQSEVIATVIGGVRPEQGLTVQLSAASADGSTKCSGTSAPFDVTANHTTSVTVTLRCPNGTPTGTVAVNGKVNVCPSIDSASASPSEANVGAVLALSASGADPDNGPAPLTYTWSASGSSGSITNSAVSTTSFVCSSSGPATVTLTVSDGDPGCDVTTTFTVMCDTVGVTLNPNVHVADAATNAALLGYDPKSGVLTYSAATAMLANLQPGDVLLSGGAVGTVAPLGYMRKIISVQVSGGVVTVATTQATVEDAVSSAKIAASQKYADARAVTSFTPTVAGVSLADPPAAVAAGSRSLLGRSSDLTLSILPPLPSTPISPSPSGGITINLNNVMVQYPTDDQFTDGGASGGLSGQIQATLNGWVNLNPTAFVDLHIEWCGPLCIRYVREFDAGVIVDQSADVQAVINASATIETAPQKLAEVQLGSFCTYVLCWFPKFEVFAKVGVTGQVTLTIHATDQVHVEAGIRWDDDGMGHSGWTNLSTASANGSFDVPSVQASVKAKAGATAQFDFFLYDVVGSTASTEEDLVLDLTTPRRPFATFGTAITGGAGVEISVFGFWQIGYSAQFPEQDFPLGESPNIPPLILSTSPSSGSAVLLDQLQLSVSADDLQDGTNLTYSWTDETGRVLGTQASIGAPSWLQPGVHDFTVAVTDAVGGRTMAKVSNVTLIASPPIVTITAPASGASESTGLGFALGASVADDRGVAHCQDPTWSFTWVDQTTSTTLASSCNGNATLTQTGPHTLVLTAIGPYGSTTSSVSVTVSDPVVLKASITSPLSGPLLASSAQCLPSPPLTLSGHAAGGSPPYAYQWSVQPLPPSGPPLPAIAIATSSTTTTAQFPSNWLDLLSPAESQGAGEKVNLIFQVTDAAGATAGQSVEVTWRCVPP